MRSHHVATLHTPLAPSVPKPDIKASAARQAEFASVATNITSSPMSFNDATTGHVDHVDTGATFELAQERRQLRRRHRSRDLREAHEIDEPTA